VSSSLRSEPMVCSTRAALSIVCIMTNIASIGSSTPVPAELMKSLRLGFDSSAATTSLVRPP
jgi:hypothetical protein